MVNTDETFGKAILKGLSFPLHHLSVLDISKPMGEYSLDFEVLNALETSVAAPEPEIASCARLGRMESLPAIRRIAFDEKADLFLRTLTVSSLGKMKDHASQEGLTHLAQTSSHVRLRRAAEAALKQIPAP